MEDSILAQAHLAGNLFGFTPPVWQPKPPVRTHSTACLGAIRLQYHERDFFFFFSLLVSKCGLGVGPSFEFEDNWKTVKICLTL